MVNPLKWIAARILAEDLNRMEMTLYNVRQSEQFWRREFDKQVMRRIDETTTDGPTCLWVCKRKALSKASTSPWRK
jgi:hypothetical protein